MTDMTIIGSGNMAGAIGTRAVAAGRAVQILDRRPENAAKLAAELGGGTTSGGLNEMPDGDLVVLALYFGPAKEVATHYGDTLSGKIVIEISNPINTDTFDSLVVAPGSSAAEEIAALLPGATVVKAFNTTFAGPLAAGAAGGQPLDVFIASDSEEARNQVAAFAAAAGLRPLQVGGLHHARELEGFELLVMGLQLNPAYESFNWGTGLKIID
ncbi:NAD(P)-binding domain-containing protein [Arthrobacter sp. UYEF20]|uniref:NADPH-dependent F420 reductase n=1 Tax=Arthrobacter sp. UYEF20 TaxID=1756363 RepID=UPI0033955350